MKYKVLLISDTFPPNPAVGGLRPFYLFKYLNNIGIDTYVFTVNYGVERTEMKLRFPEGFSSKIFLMDFNLHDQENYLESRSVFQYFRDFLNPTFSSPPGLLDEARKKILNVPGLMNFDLIISTVPDLWTARLGADLSKQYGIKFIIDFRDAIEQEIGMPRSLKQKFQIARLLLGRRRIVKKSNELVTVSNFLKTQLEKNLKRKTSVVYNGFDSDLFQNLNGKSFKIENDVVKIVYVGRILNFWYRNPLPLIEAIDRHVAHEKFELHFYGVESEFVNEISKTVKNGKVFFHGRVNYEQIPDILRRADILLVLTNLNRRGILTTKLFEYMPYNKPILCIPNNDFELKEILLNNNLGYSFENTNQILSFFQHFKSEMKKFSESDKRKEILDLYTRENQSKIFAEIIRRIIERD